MNEGHRLPSDLRLEFQLYIKIILWLFRLSNRNARQFRGRNMRDSGSCPDGLTTRPSISCSCIFCWNDCLVLDKMVPRPELWIHTKLHTTLSSELHFNIFNIRIITIHNLKHTIKRRCSSVFQQLIFVTVCTECNLYNIVINKNINLNQISF